MIQVQLYSRQDCSLCEKVMNRLDAIRQTLPFDLKETLLEEGTDLEKRYREDIPRILVNGEFFSKHTLDEASFVNLLKSIESGEHVS